MHRNTFLFPLFNLITGCRHIVSALQAGDVHFMTTETADNPGTIEGHIPAAQHHNPLSGLNRFAQTHIPQKLQANHHPLKVGAGNRQLLSCMGAHRHQNGVKPVIKYQAVQRLDLHAGLYSNPYIFNFFDFAV